MLNNDAYKNSLNTEQIKLVDKELRLIESKIRNVIHPEINGELPNSSQPALKAPDSAQSSVKLGEPEPVFKTQSPISERITDPVKKTNAIKEAQTGDIVQLSNDV